MGTKEKEFAKEILLDLIEVILKREHEHENEVRQPGESIKVRPDQAKWLEEIGTV